MRFVVLAFGSSARSDVALAPAETGTLVVDGAVHPAGFDGAAAALTGFSLVEAVSLDDVLDALPPRGTFEVRPADVT
ncbi:hypothetical protein [Cellulomonas sp. URHE0023]|uniref:hypothetical protein n=1 Tax=Cellulomonas sp. URHE0023 TaxID=1380354 RepID=UPI0004828DD2|nr:hypothetical protein [Cellulomonas sp. URHE0023]